MNVYKICIPKFSKWQKETDGVRVWFVMDRNFWMDSKIVEARQLCSDSHQCYQMLISEADNDGVVEMNERALKDFFKIRLGIVSNHFDLNKRLNALIEAELIEVETYAKETPKLLQSFSKDDSKVVQSGSKTPLEMPQMQVAVISNYKQTNKQTNKGDFDSFYQAFPNKKKPNDAKRAYEKALKSATHKQIMAGLETYKQKKESWKAWAYPASWLNGGCWNDEYTDSTPQAGVPVVSIPQTAAYLSDSEVLLRGDAIELRDPDITSYSKPVYERHELDYLDQFNLRVVSTGETLLSCHFRKVRNANHA